MGSEFLGVGVEKIRKGLTFTIRCCFRSVYNHPFLVGFLCFLILLHRSSPFVFSLLVSASPILVCTAVLLGLLLSYGEQSLPEIEIEEIKTKFETNGKGEEGLDDTAVPLIEEREIKSDGGEIREEENGEAEGVDEKLNDEVLESDGEGSETDSFDSEKVNVASLDSPPRSPWTEIVEEDEWAGGEEDKQGEEEEDFGSDEAKSSSPDASMVDIMPMLDELHPLLDEETSHLQPVRGSQCGSDVASESSSDSSFEENHDNLEDDQDEDDDNEEGEGGAQGDKEELAKSVITWTEEDQKNLMNLGSSEIERNQRLENLILKRRSRKDMSMIHERNLIDLESNDYPLGLPPISTRRRNPFDDLHHDFYDDNMGLPLIPGSAPSVMLQRGNPFDIPYDLSEEKPDLMGGEFKEELTKSQSRGAVFRRHESFSVGPSVFAPDGKGARMRPYFVPENMISEESSYSSSFPRQSSEFSESKVSYVPETESTALEAIPLPTEIYGDQLGDPHLISHQEDEKEEDISVGHGSRSSEDEASLEVGRAKLEIQLENVADHYQEEMLTGSMEAQTSEYHPNNVGDEHVYRHDSSSSSLSEVSERVFTEIVSEELSVLEETRNVGILSHAFTESINLSDSGPLAIDIPQRPPVYDSSPRLDENSIVPESTPTTHPMDADVDAHQRDADKLIYTSSVEGNGYPFHDAGEIRELNFQHLDEVRASGALVELDSFENDSSKVQELDRDIQSNINSPFSPKSISNPPSATETTESHFNVQQPVEQVDEIKEIDEDILAELDSVGDFSVQQFGTGSTGFEKHFDSVGENGIEADVLRSEKWRQDIDIHGEGVECVSEPRITKASGSDNIEVSRTEFGERDNLDSPDSKTSEKLEMQSDEKNNYFTDEVKSEALVENETSYTKTDYRMSELEASKIEDIDLAFKDVAAKETVVEETLVEHSKKESSSVTGSTLEAIEENASLGSTQPLPDSVDRAIHVIGSEGTQGISSGKSIPSEEATLSSNESVEVNADEASPSVLESMVENSVAAEKPGNEVEVPKDSGSITCVKGKDAGSSSSSSSSSDSSSGDSDKE